MKKLRLILGLFFLSQIIIQPLAAQVGLLIPENTATHTAVKDGSWFDAAVWDAGTVPGDAAIVVIPFGKTVEYIGCSDAQVFAIRVGGNFNCRQPNSDETTCLTFDTFVAMHGSFVRFEANQPTDGKIDVTIAPFDIEAHKSGTSGYNQIWNSAAKNHFSDGATVWEVTREVGPDRRYNTYQEAINGNTFVKELSRNRYDDGAGVTGRYKWDSEQHSIGFMSMGQLEIIGKEKLNMSKLTADAKKGTREILLEKFPMNWQIDDEILVTRGGNISTSSNDDEVAVIQSLDGKTVFCESNLDNNHEGRPLDTLHCYAGNLTRNIIFRSAVKNQIHQRGHFMAMHNNLNIQIRNAVFIDMGRTDKSRVLDDFVWDKWIEPKVFKSKISPLGQEICVMKGNPTEEITNTRGRYSIHLHKTGARHTDQQVFVTGNVVRGNPGWGITHHDSYADVSNNVVFDVTGGGIVSETGSEMGSWDHNLVVDIKQGHKMDPYDAAVFHDDYLFSGQGLAMKGRAVICRDNVIVGAKQGVGVINMNPSVTNHDRVDPLALARFRSGFEIDQFPLSRNGYSSEGDGVMPVEVALIMKNTTVIDCQMGLRSIERDPGINHESRSVFDGYKAWGSKQGLSITYQADYSFKNVFISGDGTPNSVGIFVWKHSHNQSFENIKLADLEAGILVSKLVESDNGELKTRNNGFTPWIFVDLKTENVDKLYQIEKEDPATTTPYTEHSDNTIHLSSNELVHRPTTFTMLDPSIAEVDYTAEDFRFEVDGVITDDFGSYEMGLKQAEAQGTLRLDYPERIYEFASKAKFEEFLTINGVYKNQQTSELYFILNELLPNRRTFEYTSFPIRIKIKNAPSTGVFANPKTESAAALAPQYELVSRRASARQSSTRTGLNYEGASIDPHAEKAVDGNVNGRINCQIFQQNLLPVGSFSETKTEDEPWFELDLGERKVIQFIDIWNAVDLNGSDLEHNSNHLGNFYVLISDQPFGNADLATARSIARYEHFVPPHGGNPKRKISLNFVNRGGRFVRIQGAVRKKLKFAEVEIIGKTDDGSVAVFEPKFDDFKVFPNPSGSVFNIEIPSGKTAKSATVYDLNGRLVFGKKDIQSAFFEIELNGSPGIYLLEILTKEDEKLVRKIMVVE